MYAKDLHTGQTVLYKQKKHIVQRILTRHAILTTDAQLGEGFKAPLSQIHPHMPPPEWTTKQATPEDLDDIQQTAEVHGIYIRPSPKK